MSFKTPQRTVWASRSGCNVRPPRFGLSGRLLNCSAAADGGTSQLSCRGGRVSNLKPTIAAAISSLTIRIARRKSRAGGRESQGDGRTVGQWGKLPQIFRCARNLQWFVASAKSPFRRNFRNQGLWTELLLVWRLLLPRS